MKQIQKVISCSGSGEVTKVDIKCKLCMFFDISAEVDVPNDVQSISGKCYRYPEPIDKHMDNWCGEFILDNKN